MSVVGKQETAASEEGAGIFPVSCTGESGQMTWRPRLVEPRRDSAVPVDADRIMTTEQTLRCPTPETAIAERRLRTVKSRRECLQKMRIILVKASVGEPSRHSVITASCKRAHSDKSQQGCTVAWRQRGAGRIIPPASDAYGRLDHQTLLLASSL